MSTPTEHLGLHQWEPEDAFLRADFNEDHGKLDAAVGALQEWASSACVAGSVVIPEDRAPVTVELGFRPKLVVLGNNGKEYYTMSTCLGGYCLTNYYKSGFSSPSISTSQTAAFTDTGFQIQKLLWFGSGDTVRYVAFR